MNDEVVCAVCKDKALKFKYSQYGVTSCLSCRAFFRRSIHLKSFLEYRCPRAYESEECKVTKQSRKKCAKCRFQKCLEAGMSHTNLGTANLSHDRDKMTINRLLRIDQDTKLPWLSICAEMVSKLHVSSLPDYLTTILSGGIMDYKTLSFGYAMGIQKIIRFAKQLDEFTELSPYLSDKVRLLGHNVDAMFNIRCGYFFQSDAPSFVHQVDRLGIFDLST